MEYSLPFDTSRCFPANPDEWCKQCLRWNALPNQTFGSWQSCFSTIDSKDEACKYIPINHDKTNVY